MVSGGYHPIPTSYLQRRIPERIHDGLAPDLLFVIQVKLAVPCRRPRDGAGFDVNVCSNSLRLMFGDEAPYAKNERLPTCNGPAYLFLSILAAK